MKDNTQRIMNVFDLQKLALLGGIVLLRDPIPAAGLTSKVLHDADTGSVERSKSCPLAAGEDIWVVYSQAPGICREGSTSGSVCKVGGSVSTELAENRRVQGKIELLEPIFMESRFVARKMNDVLRKEQSRTAQQLLLKVLSGW